MSMPDAPLWVPSRERIAGANMTAFMRTIEERFGISVPDYTALHRFSIDRNADFWRTMWDAGGIVGTQGERAMERPGEMPGARYFPDARINFAENLLKRRDSAPAIVFNGEGQRRRTLTFGDLAREVGAFAGALRRAGVHAGDRVGGYIPNMPEAVIAGLGAAAVGAVWSSCSPDFGVQGGLERFGQIDPRVIVSAVGYF